MKITLNLSSEPSPRERYALAWTLPVVIVALIGLAFLLRASLVSWRDYRKYQAGLGETERQETRLRAHQANLEAVLNQPEFSEVYRDSKFINSLVDRRQFSVADLAQTVTMLMPTSVHLVGLGLARQESKAVVRFTMVGETEEAIENFLVRLEDSPSFEKVEILNQDVGQTDSGSTQVLLTCAAHYVASAGGAGDR